MCPMDFVINIIIFSVILIIDLTLSLRAIWLYSQNKDPLGALIPPNPIKNLYNSIKNHSEKKLINEKLEKIG